LGIQLAKGVWETFVNHKKEFTKQQLEYAATDVSVLFSIQEAQKRALVNENLEKIAALEFRLIPVVAEME
ncbi:DNA-directed DNA polymerase, partial [Candidatus Saccharibacteria bacterium]|nr:DNA-directed DNA polymerase [Candidatus Saccharibacteria bacterium]